MIKELAITLQDDPDKPGERQVLLTADVEGEHYGAFCALNSSLPDIDQIEKAAGFLLRALRKTIYLKEREGKG